MTDAAHVLLSLNCEWPGFSSTVEKAKPWPTRFPQLASAVADSDATVVTAQELGESEAPDIAEKLGRRWSYQRKGLNVIMWRDDWDLVDPNYDNQSRDLTLPACGQYQRTAIACRLVHKESGEHFFPISTHFATAARDMTKTDARRARQKQARVVARRFDSYRRCLIAGDFNERGENRGPRALLHGAGFTFLEESPADVAHDPHHGIDAIGAQAGVTLLSRTLVDLGSASDHDGHLVHFTVTPSPGQSSVAHA